MANILYENGFPIKAIVNGKLVDVQEVRHGRWKYKPAYTDALFGFYICTECGAASWACSSPYCPNCGAKMDLEGNNG